MKKIKNILIDFDGTLIDPFERLYQLYKDLTRQYSRGPILSKRLYRRYKREGMSEEEIFLQSAPDEFFSIYQQERQGLIETEKYLQFDRLIPTAREALKVLSSLFDLVLLSGRKNRTLLDYQLQKLDIDLFFDMILPAGFENKSKEELVRNNLCIFNDNTVIIGDTEEDIIVGKKLGLLTVAVSSGLRRETFLTSYQPDYLVDDIFSVVSLVKKMASGF